MKDLAIGKLELQDGDVLVIRSSERLSAGSHKAVYRAAAMAIEKAGIQGVSILVMDPEFSLDVVRKDAA